MVPKDWKMSEETKQKMSESHLLIRAAYGKNMNYRNKEWLEQKYLKEELPLNKLGDLLNCSSTTIWKWIKRHNIPMRSLSESKRAERNPNWEKRGDQHPRWKGGRKNCFDYVLLLMPNHPNACPNGYIYEHRLVMEEVLGRPLRPEEVIHHINGIKDDNCKENLMPFPNIATHNKYHAKLRRGDK